MGKIAGDPLTLASGLELSEIDSEIVSGTNSNDGVGGSPHTNNNSWIPAGYRNSDTMYLEILQVKVSVLARRLQPTPHPHFKCHSQALVDTCASDLPATDWRFPQPPPWTSDTSLK